MEDSITEFTWANKVSLCASYWNQDPCEEEWCLCSRTLSSSCRSSPPISPRVFSVPFQCSNPSGLGFSAILMLQRLDARLLWIVAACSLAALLWVPLFCSLFFTTLFSIDMNFEDLSILKNGQALLSRVVEVSDLPKFDKFHLSSIEYKLKFSRWPSCSFLRAGDPP